MSFQKFIPLANFLTHLLQMITYLESLFFFLKYRNKCLVCTIFTMKASPRTFQTFGIMGNRQPSIRPSDVCRFSCICNALALANLTGAQSLWRDWYNLMKMIAPSHHIAGSHKGKPNQGRDNIRPLVILRIVNNHSRQRFSSLCALACYLLVPWGVYVLSSYSPIPTPRHHCQQLDLSSFSSKDHDSLVSSSPEGLFKLSLK